MSEKKFFKKILVGVLLVSAVACLFFQFRRKPLEISRKYSSVFVSGHAFEVESAVEQSDRIKGLGGRKAICQDCGMLFVFEGPGRYSFWMKDMLFSLDILWIREGKVVFVAKDVAADFSGIITPTESADQVLEVNAGTVDKLKIKVGDEVSTKK